MKLDGFIVAFAIRAAYIQGAAALHGNMPIPESSPRHREMPAANTPGWMLREKWLQ